MLLTVLGILLATPLDFDLSESSLPVFKKFRTTFVNARRAWHKVVNTLSLNEGKPTTHLDAWGRGNIYMNWFLKLFSITPLDEKKTSNNAESLSFPIELAREWLFDTDQQRLIEAMEKCPSQASQNPILNEVSSLFNSFSTLFITTFKLESDTNTRAALTTIQSATGGAMSGLLFPSQDLADLDSQFPYLPSLERYVIRSDMFVTLRLLGRVISLSALINL